MNIIKLPFEVNSPILASGADIKGAFALAKTDTAYLYDGFGDLSVPENIKAYEKAVTLAVKKHGIKPEIIACDSHPGYFSGRFAERYSQRLRIPELYRIQHHEAHVASGIIEHSVRSDIIGIAFDGTGYGTDGCVWGGEFFTGSLKRLDRSAHFEYIHMPGGDAAVRQPWRMAVSYLYRTFGEDYLKLKIDLVKKLGRTKWPVIKKMIDGNINSPMTSSAGRLFDAVASIVLARDQECAEAELPIELEQIADKDCHKTYDFDISAISGQLVIETPKMIRGIVNDIISGREKGFISARFHNTIAEAISEVSARLRRAGGIGRVTLGGGVFQNRYLTARTAEALGRNGFEVLLHSVISANDNGIPLGQIALANVRAKCV